MIKLVLEFYRLRDDPAPDNIRVLFVCKGGDWHIGTWDSDHDHYTDDYSQDLYDIILWAYIPDDQWPYPSQVIVTDTAAQALYNEYRKGIT